MYALLESYFEDIVTEYNSWRPHNRKERSVLASNLISAVLITNISLFELKEASLLSGVRMCAKLASTMIVTIGFNTSRVISECNLTQIDIKQGRICGF